MAKAKIQGIRLILPLFASSFLSRKLCCKLTKPSEFAIRKFSVKLEGKAASISARKVSFLGKALGLMFRSRNTSNLLFDFERKSNIGLHSLFVFFPFMVIWLDDKNNVLDWQIAKPFSWHISSQCDFSKIIEVPLNSKNKGVIEFFVGSRKV